MQSISQIMKANLDAHPINLGESDCETVMEQIFQAYAEFHESDPVEIRENFKELGEILNKLSLDDNNAVFGLTCRISIATEKKAFLDGLQYGAQLMQELIGKEQK